MQLWKLKNSKMCSWETGDPGNADSICSSLKDGRLETQDKPIFLFEIKGGSSRQAGDAPSYSAFYILFRFSINWIRIIHIRIGNLIYSDNLIHKHSHRHTQNTV